MNVDVSPDMQFYNLLESYPYSPTGALCEYIDNALEAFQTATEKIRKDLGGKLKIEIEFSPNTITIKDHGRGINIQDLQRAVKPAYTAGRQSLSEFGIGMKAASIWFGRKWELMSYPYHSKDKFSFVFDLDSLLEKNTEKVEVKVSKKKSDGMSNGLEITLSKLKRTIDRRVAEIVWNEIQETYHFFTMGNNPSLEITFSFQKTPLIATSFEDNGRSPLKYPLCKFKQKKDIKELYVIGKSRIWKKDICFEFNGLPITGFISLRTVSSQATNPGIRLFRYGRLIQGSERKPYRPVSLLGAANKHAPSRFYGELHLDGQPISNSKGGFVFDEELFLTTLENQEGVKEFISQAENYRAKLVEAGDVINCKNTSEYEKLSGAKPERPRNIQSRPKPTPTKKPQKKSSKSPINHIESLAVPDDFLLLENFTEESSRLYKEGRLWPFCLCYRVLLEVSIIQKIKHSAPCHYDKVRDKSIVGLFKYLHSNSDIVPSEYRTFKRVLKTSALEQHPFIELLNLSSHGHYSVIKPEVDSLLANTQQVIEWAFSDD